MTPKVKIKFGFLDIPANKIERKITIEAWCAEVRQALTRLAYSDPK